MKDFDIIVIGAGLAGMSAALKCSESGKKVLVVAFGQGSHGSGTGCIDLVSGGSLVEFIRTRPEHPYAKLGEDKVIQPLEWFKRTSQLAGEPLEGIPGKIMKLPTALGTLKPTCLAPARVAMGSLDRMPWNGESAEPAELGACVIVVGFSGYRDFNANLAARAFSVETPGDKPGDRRAKHPRVYAIEVNLPERSGDRADLNAIQIASKLESDPKYVEALCSAILARASRSVPEIGSASRARVLWGFPGVLGRDPGLAPETAGRIERALGGPVFEIPGLPPTAPGHRLALALERLALKRGVRIHKGAKVVGCERDGRRIAFVIADTPAGKREYSADAFILATGRFLGGGLSSSGCGKVVETALGLPVFVPDGAWSQSRFFPPAGGDHGFELSGIPVDRSMRALDSSGEPVFDNLFAAGNIIAHVNPIATGTAGGTSVCTGVAAASSAISVGSWGS